MGFNYVFAGIWNLVFQPLAIGVGFITGDFHFIGTVFVLSIVVGVLAPFVYEKKEDYK